MITWPLLWAVPEPPSFRTRPRWFPAHRDAPRSAIGTVFPERSPPGPGRGLQPPGAGGGEPPPVSAQGLGAQAAAPRRPRLHSSRASPLQRRTWRALGVAWQLLGPCPSTLEVLHPTSGLPLLVRPQSRPSWGPETTQVHPGREHSLWEWAGGSPAGPPPGLSSWARTEGRVGAHSFHRLAQGWAGMPWPTRGLLGTPPLSPGCGHGLAGHPQPGPDLEEHARGPRWQAARIATGNVRPAEEPLCLPPVHSGQRLHWSQSSWQMSQDQWGRPPPFPPLPGGCGPCCFQRRWVPVPGELAPGPESCRAQPTAPSRGHGYPRPGAPTQRRGFPLGPAGEIRGLWPSGPRGWLQPLGTGWGRATPAEVWAGRPLGPGRELGTHAWG